MNIKSPLRYPGGKSKALTQILPRVPTDIQEYREPFIGGGSVFFAIKQQSPLQSWWVNDLNRDLFCFWQRVQNDLAELVAIVQQVKDKYMDGRQLYAEITHPDLKLTDEERAVRFFLLNRITFSGTVESGGYSQQAFEKRFTQSAIDRLANLQGLLDGVTITNEDYNYSVLKPGKDVFLFLDPPYLSATQSKLYGVKGSLHTGFDHERFAQVMQRCPHRWLITYDDCPQVRELFGFAKITEWNLQYGMNNYKQKSAAAGKELFIQNY